MCHWTSSSRSAPRPRAGAPPARPAPPWTVRPITVVEHRLPREQPARPTPYNPRPAHVVGPRLDRVHEPWWCRRCRWRGCPRRSEPPVAADRRTDRAPGRRRCRPGSCTGRASCAATGHPQPVEGQDPRSSGDYQPISRRRTGIGNTPLRRRRDHRGVDVARADQVVVAPTAGRTERRGLHRPSLSRPQPQGVARGRTGVVSGAATHVAWDTPAREVRCRPPKTSADCSLVASPVASRIDDPAGRWRGVPSGAGDRHRRDGGAAGAKAHASRQLQRHGGASDPAIDGSSTFTSRWPAPRGSSPTSAGWRRSR